MWSCPEPGALMTRTVDSSFTWLQSTIPSLTQLWGQLKAWPDERAQLATSCNNGAQPMPAWLPSPAWSPTSIWSDTIQAGPTQTGAIAEHDLVILTNWGIKPMAPPCHGTQAHSLRPCLNRGGAQPMVSPEHRIHSAALPNQEDHTVASLECRAQPATIQPGSSASSTSWPESMGSDFTHQDTPAHKHHHLIP